MTHPYGGGPQPCNGPLSVFLAGPSQELDRVLAARKMLRDHGIECTSSWISLALADRVEGETDSSKGTEERARIRHLLVTDLERSNHVWALAPSEGCSSRGVWAEVHHALLYQIPCAVTGYDARGSVYTEGACLVSETDADAIYWLLGRRDGVQA